MKKILILLSFLFLTFQSNAQSEESTTYKIFRTELYIYNENSEKWVMETRNDDVNINMVSYKNVINIQAKTPSLYRIDKLSEKNIGGRDKDFFGVRYNAIECVDMKKCTIDLVRLSDLTSKSFIFSVVFENETLGKVNLRFYSTLD